MDSAIPYFLYTLRKWQKHLIPSLQIDVKPLNSIFDTSYILIGMCIWHH